MRAGLGSALALGGIVFSFLGLGGVFSFSLPRGVVPSFRVRGASRREGRAIDQSWLGSIGWVRGGCEAGDVWAGTVGGGIFVRGVNRPSWERRFLGGALGRGGEGRPGPVGWGFFGIRVLAEAPAWVVLVRKVLPLGVGRFFLARGLGGGGRGSLATALGWSGANGIPGGRPGDGRVAGGRMRGRVVAAAGGFVRPSIWRRCSAWGFVPRRHGGGVAALGGR